MRAAHPVAAILLLVLASSPAAGAPAPDVFGGAAPEDVEPETPVHLRGFAAANEADVAAFDVAFFVDGELFEVARVGPLAAFTTAFFATSRAVSLPAGPHTFRFVVDANDEIVESDEANNDISAVAVFSHERPDLVTRIVGERDSWPLGGGAIDYEICDAGGRAPFEGAFASWIVTHGASVRFGSDDLPTLAPGECAVGSVAFGGTLEPGAFKVTVAAVPRGLDEFYERHKDDNRASAEAYIGPRIPPAP